MNVWCAMRNIRNHFIFLLVLFIPCLVWAKDVNDLIYRWEKTSSNFFYYNIGESDNNIIMYDNNGFLESYNKKTGDKKFVKLDKAKGIY